MIFVTGLSSGVVATVLLPVTSGLLGASGICFAFSILSAAQGIRVVSGSQESFEVPVSFLFCGLLFLWREVSGSFENDGVSHLAHLLGGICGAAFGVLLSAWSASGGAQTKSPFQQLFSTWFPRSAHTPRRSSGFLNMALDTTAEKTT